MAELGILGICIPVSYGGQGFDYLTLGLVCEELERVDTSLRVVMSVHMGLNSLALLQWGTEEQKQKFLVPQARGEKYAGFGLTEPDVGSDVVNDAVDGQTARRRVRPQRRENVDQPGDESASFPGVAKTDPDAGHKGLTAFHHHPRHDGPDDGRSSRQTGRAGRIDRLGG